MRVPITRSRLSGFRGGGVALAHPPCVACGLSAGLGGAWGEHQPSARPSRSRKPPLGMSSLQRFSIGAWRMRVLSRRACLVAAVVAARWLGEWLGGGVGEARGWTTLFAKGGLGRSWDEWVQGTRARADGPCVRGALAARALRDGFRGASEPACPCRRSTAPTAHAA